ncbi:MAG: hypothetical protein GSR74_02715 [Desulfurococcales archaeon]|nr:hypothetical protein [Desulfurococcales archaeon]
MEKTKILVIIILIMIMVSPLAQAQETKTPTGTGGKERALRADFYLVAVTGGKHEKGLLVPVTITITRGDGEIKVTAGGKVGNTTFESTLVAVKLASLLAGVDWRKMDYNVTFHTESGIDGPSGSMMITLVTYTLLSNSPRGNGYKWFVATGAISPDGLASSVGAVGVKCQAVSSNGKAFYYPLVNLTKTLEEKCEGEPYTSLYNLTASVYSLREPRVEAPLLLPASFNKTMINAAKRMQAESESLLLKAGEAGASNSTLAPVYKYLNESEELLDKHPYAAASLAFTALMRAYQAYYSTIALEKDYKDAKRTLDEVAANISRSLDDLEEQLDRLPRNGSIYYLEFLATAYTRIAAARSSILAYEKYSTSPQSFMSAVSELAHAAARITSIREWIITANASRSEKPSLTSEEVEKLAYILRDYASSVIGYARTLAKYVVENYGRSKDLLVYIDILDSLQSQAEAYMRKGNPLGAIGFYRDALSESLRMMFQASIQAYKGPGDVRDAYARELATIYGILAGKLLTRGYSLGLAPAYKDYAGVLAGMGDKNGQIQLLDEAVVSETVWLLSSLTSTASNATSKPIAPATGAGKPGLTGSIAVLIAAVAIVMYILGYLSSVRSLTRPAYPY